MPLLRRQPTRPVLYGHSSAKSQLVYRGSAHCSTRNKEAALESEARIRASGHWLLAGMSPSQARRLLSMGREARFEPGEIVFREGGVADRLYLLSAGRVGASATAEAGPTDPRV